MESAQVQFCRNLCVVKIKIGMNLKAILDLWSIGDCKIGIQNVQS